MLPSLGLAALTRAAACRARRRAVQRARPPGDLASRESARLRALFDARGGFHQAPVFPVGSPEGANAPGDSVPVPTMTTAPEDRLIPGPQGRGGGVPDRYSGARACPIDN